MADKLFFVHYNNLTSLKCTSDWGCYENEDGIPVPVWVASVKTPTSTLH